jgi:hypothetical protein
MGEPLACREGSAWIDDISFPAGAVGLAWMKDQYAKVEKVEGEVEVKRPGDKDWVRAEVNMDLSPGTEVSTSIESSVKLQWLFPDGQSTNIVVKVGELTIMKVNDIYKKRDEINAKIDVKIGSIEFNIGKKEKYRSNLKVSTHSSVAGVTGTIFSVSNSKDNVATIKVVEGSVVVMSNLLGRGDYWEEVDGPVKWPGELALLDRVPVLKVTVDAEGYILGEEVIYENPRDWPLATEGFEHLVYPSWDKTFVGEDELNEGRSVQQTSDGGYILLGYTGDGWHKHALLIKTNVQGDKEWDRTFDDNGSNGYSVQPTSDGGYILVGSRKNVEWRDDVWLVKTDSHGNTQWEGTFGEVGKNGVGYAVQQTYDGGYILIGTIESDKGNKDIWLIKIDSHGNKVWDEVIPGLDHDDIGYSVLETYDGYLLFGYKGSQYCHDLWVAKTDSLGNIYWERFYDKWGLDNIGRCAQATSYGGYIISGYTDYWSSNGYNIFLMKIDEDGEVEWLNIFDTSEDDRGYCVQETSDGGYILVGCWGDWGDHSIWLIKTDCYGEKEWSKSFALLDNNVGYSVQPTSDGGYVLLGTTEVWAEDQWGDDVRVRSGFWLLKYQP